MDVTGKNALIWVQDAFLQKGYMQEKVLILICTENAEVARGYIQYYQQKHQLKLIYTLNILPLNRYIEFHCDDDLAGKIYTEIQRLSTDTPVILFELDKIQLPQTSNPNLIKHIFNIPSWKEQITSSNFPLFEIPQIIQEHLWNSEHNDRCYGLINAATVWLFPDLFKQEKLRYACLFQGEKAEVYAKSAPYLVELPIEHSGLHHLFCRNGENYEKGINYGELNIGTFFRSQADFDKLLNHFRKWLILPDSKGHYYYLNFFSPKALENYLDRLQHYPTKLAAFFNGNMIEKMFCIKNGDELVEYVPNVDLSTFKQAKKQFDNFEIDAFIKIHEDSCCADIHKFIMANYPEFAVAYGEGIVGKTINHAYRLAKAVNMQETSSILLMAFVNLLYGDSINYLDSEGLLNKILTTNNTSEAEKQYQVEKRLKELESQGHIHQQIKGIGSKNDGLTTPI